VSEPVSSEMRATIQSALAEIESKENATILFAAESGSRAWGFHSPDSDYDVRFIYARPVDWHLSIAPGRDVIERPIDAELDLGGWDLRKTLGLILKSNAVVLEWLHSPINYRDSELRQELLDFCKSALRLKPLIYHYHRLGARQRDGIFLPDGTVKLKRYFYTLRPALVLRWLRMNGGGLVPMNIKPLMAETELPATVSHWIEELIAIKKETGEMGTSERTNAEVDQLLDEEFVAADQFLKITSEKSRPNLQNEADDLHRRWVHKVTEIVS